ncbi:MAG: hypothetical protein Q8942_10845 [Bacillota bacterium]|nr:hypothetical protein [Bacillota bacterium]
MHQSVSINVNSVNYNVCETLSTSGVFTPQLFEYLSDSLSKYGNYLIKIKLEKQLKAGVYDTYFFSSEDLKKEISHSNTKQGYYELLNRKLSIGDKVTIYVEDNDLTLFGRLINATFLGSNTNRAIDTRIKSLKSCVISNEPKDLVKGYDVIADIKNRQEPLVINVSTKLDSDIYVYDKNNPIYGDSSNEKISGGIPGSDYILETGEFLREFSYENDGSTIKEITYTQQ